LLLFPFCCVERKHDRWEHHASSWHYDTFAHAEMAMHVYTTQKNASFTPGIKVMSVWNSTRTRNNNCQTWKIVKFCISKESRNCYKNIVLFNEWLFPLEYRKLQFFQFLIYSSAHNGAHSLQQSTPTPHIQGATVSNDDNQLCWCDAMRDFVEASWKQAFSRDFSPYKTRVKRSAEAPRRAKCSPYNALRANFF
jgi:hypothetical protein